MIVGIDTNILCYALDPVYPEHSRCIRILNKLGPGFRVALNPTIVHEAYHVLVFGQKWVPSEAEKRLRLLLHHPYVEFRNLTRRISFAALALASEYGLGGRDSLILASLLLNKIPVLYTHDAELLQLRKVEWGRWGIKFKDAVSR